jgi:hypothetical protein
MSARNAEEKDRPIRSSIVTICTAEAATGVNSMKSLTARRAVILTTSVKTTTEEVVVPVTVDSEKRLKRTYLDHLSSD